MAINRDYVDPDELTTQVRTALADQDINGPNTLADLLPSEVLDDIEYEADAGQGGLITAADYRAFDGTLTIGRDEALGALRGRIHPLGQRIPLMEEERLRMRNNSEQLLRSAIERMAARAAKAVALQINLKRAEALFTGKLHFEGNGQNFDVDFGRRPDFTKTAVDLWTDPDSDPFTQLEEYVDEYETVNGFKPEKAITTLGVQRALFRHPKVMAAALGVKVSDLGERRASGEQINAVLDQYGLPRFEVRGGKIKVRNKDHSETVKDLLPQGQILFLQGGGDAAVAGSSSLGFTAWGTTLEATKSAWGISDQPGIVAAVFETEDIPSRMHVVASAIGMPVLNNPDYAMSVKVV